jgi:hypothetical protein
MLTSLALLLVTTQISFGCPGPVRETGPTCNPWHAFPHARLAVARAGGASRIVVSDAAGRLRLRLAPGSYAVTPLAQAHARAGAVLHVRVRPGAVTRLLVRFEGFPQML